MLRSTVRNHGARRGSAASIPANVVQTFNPKQLGILSVFRIYGSVLPRCFLWAGCAGTFGGLIEAYGLQFAGYQEVWKHPYALHVFGMVLGFSLVMRIQIAYQRYWEGATACHQAASKWADSVMQVFAFDEASKDAFSDAALEFRMLCIHYTSLMHALSLIDMRQDEELDQNLTTLQREDPFMFKPMGDRPQRRWQQQYSDGDTVSPEDSKVSSPDPTGPDRIRQDKARTARAGPDRT